MTQGKTRREAKVPSAPQLTSDLAPGKYHDGGGIGLYLREEKNKARFWVQRVTIRGTRREIGLGSPPLVSLATARAEATRNKQLAMSGGDPLAEKRKARAVLTFAQSVNEYLAGKLDEFRNDKHRKQW